MKKKTYRTKGKDELIAYLAAHPDCQFTTEELCIAVNGDASCGKSSIYRRLTQLCEEQTVRKFRSDDRDVNVYQYVGAHCDCSRHFHEKCTACGKIQHLDCSDSVAFALHLLQEHGFEIDCGQTILYGLCANCRSEKGAHPHA